MCISRVQSSLLGLVSKLQQENYCRLFFDSPKKFANMSCVKRDLEENCESSESQEKPTSETVSTKRRRFDISQIRTPLDVSGYYVENGLRKVYPYMYTFYANCKGRWVGRKLAELFQKEFCFFNEELANEKCKNGCLKVNGQLVDGNYVLKDNDFITNQAHRHESSVLAAPIPIIHMDEHFLVIDKPPSLPVHPCGKYRLNCILSLLATENNITNLHIVHRLDRLTSGVMVFARTKANAQRLHETMRNREMHKEYVCRVEGEFADGVVECEQPILQANHKIGICTVSPDGKPSKTVFERLNYNGKSSTVLCKPLTGRMHQIRVHLQCLGHPIVNDHFYNSLVFGPNKGKGGDYGKSLEQLYKDIEGDHQMSKYIQSSDTSNDQIKDQPQNEKDSLAIKALEHYTSQESWTETKKQYEFDPAKLTTEDGCIGCKVKLIDPTPSEQFIYLHALRYKAKEWSFETEMPVWAKETWTYD